MNKRREAELIGAYSRFLYFACVALSAADLLLFDGGWMALMLAFSGAFAGWVAKDTDRALRAHTEQHEEAHQEGDDDGED